MPRGKLVRRLAISCCVLGLAVAAPASAAKREFRYGVSSGDVTSHSAILWAKARHPGPILLQLERGARFGACDPEDARARLVARPKDDSTVQKRIRGLAAGASYTFRFCRPGAGHSATGRFATAPAPSAGRTVRFAVTGDQDARPRPGGHAPFWNRFGVWSRIRAESNDFNVLLGDTIYSDTEVPGYGLADVATTVEQKWKAYRTNLAMRPWARARGAAAYYAHWDDHEFINDFSPLESSFPYSNEGEPQGTTRLDGDVLYHRGVRAFRDYNPITYSKRYGIYRSIRWGKNLELFFLDERSFRSARADYGGACDNPAGSGSPDLAPTAPPEIRTLFGLAVAPSLLNPPPPACTEAINDEDRTMLGDRQLTRFEDEVESSKATFKVILNEVPIQQFYALPYDRWEGYEAERSSLVRYLQNKVDNVIFLTTDVHANLVNEIRFGTVGLGGVRSSGILDVTTGPVATETYSSEIDTTLGGEGVGAQVHDLFFKSSPPVGVGMQCAASDQFSYAEVTASAERLKIELLDGHGDAVLDTGNRDEPGPPCDPIVLDRK